MPSNDHSASHLTLCLFLHYQGNADQAKYVLKYAKNVKNISDIIAYNLKKHHQFFKNNFRSRFFRQNWLSNDCLSSHLTQLLLLHYLGKTDQANHGLKWMKYFSKLCLSRPLVPNSQSITMFDCHKAVCLSFTIHLVQPEFSLVVQVRGA